MRGNKAKKRIIESDALYKSKQVQRFINNVMLHGEKATAEGIVYGMLDKLNEARKDALHMFEQALKNVMPLQEVRAKRVGGATYQVPMPVKHDRSEALAMRWIINAARGRKGKPMLDKLTQEITDAFNSTGAAIKKRDEVHKMAEANKAFSHFAR